MNAIALPSVAQLVDSALAARFEQFASDLRLLLGKAQRFFWKDEAAEVQAELERVQKEFALPARLASFHDLAALQGRLQRDVTLIRRSAAVRAVRQAEIRRPSPSSLSLALTASAC